MSLGGIAIAIGAMVDAAIIMIENAHKHLERLKPGAARRAHRRGRQEVGPALFFSLLVITVSFLPVFTLEDQEGRLFRPLAFTKTFAMAGGALLSVTLVPLLMCCSSAAASCPRHRNPINRVAHLALSAVHRRSCCAAGCRPSLLAVLMLAAPLAGSCGSAASSCRRSTKARCSICR